MPYMTDFETKVGLVDFVLHDTHNIFLSVDLRLGYRGY